MPAAKTPTHAPERSLDQRMDALRRANDVRVRRAQLKKDLKDGKVRIQTILGDPPEYVETAKVIDILMAVPKFGRVKAARFLNTCRIRQSKTVGGLSGPSLKPIALHAVHACYTATQLPIVGMGGVASAEDVVDMVACGAPATRHRRSSSSHSRAVRITCAG